MLKRVWHGKDDLDPLPCSNVIGLILQPLIGNGDVSIWVKYSLAGRYKCNQPINLTNSAKFWWMVLSCKSAEQKRQEKNRKKRTSCWPLVRLNKCGVHRHHLWKSWRGGRDPRWSYLSKSRGGVRNPVPHWICAWTLLFVYLLYKRAIEHFSSHTGNEILSFTHGQLNIFL